MIQIERSIMKQYRDGDISTKDLADYLLRTFPVTEIALALAETVEFEDDFKPITITEDEFRTHFRIKGVRTDGTPENRGKRRKDI